MSSCSVRAGTPALTAIRSGPIETRLTGTNAFCGS
jgi:hypothetical protein